MGQFSSIALDSTGRPWISHYDASNQELVATTINNGQTSSFEVAESTNVGQGSSIAIDFNNTIHIAYRDTANNKLKYAYSTDSGFSWTIDSTLIESGGISPSIGIDSNGKVHISHQANNKVRYVTNTGGGWASQVVLNSGSFADPSAPSSLTLESDLVYIVGNSASPSQLQFATNESTSWAESTIASNIPFQTGPSIVVSGAGSIYVSLPTSTALRVASNEGSGWNLTNVAEVACSQTGIDIDSSGKLHVCYYDARNSALGYATNFSGEWKTFVLDSEGDVGNYCDIAIDTNDRLHISYYDATNGDLKYITTAD